MTEKMGVYEFGQTLLEADDLDPVYTVLHGAALEPDLLRRWLLAYWCFYHVGTASWIAGAEAGYWDRMRTAAGSKAYPRSSERRHFRGENARKSVAFLESKGVPALFEPFTGEPTVRAVMETVKTWVGFGPWIAFKVADMLERLDVCRVRFDGAAMFLFDSPKEGAAMMWQHYHDGGPVPAVGVYTSWAVTELMKGFTMNDAPPRYDRKVNEQEVETILCKWKSYMGGHYEPGEDVAAVRTGLLKFARTPLCQRLYAAGRQEGLWSCRS